MTTEPVVQNRGKSLKVGITAGASGPANLIEATILRIADLRKEQNASGLVNEKKKSSLSTAARPFFP